MRFCMLTTFYGAHSFGGDAAYVERLSRALARRGHQVDVVHCADAFHAVAGAHPLRAHTPAEGVAVHTLESGYGALSPLWSHQTGRPGPKRRALDRVLESEYDVVHFHNVSLLGAPDVLQLTDGSGEAIRLMSAHEYWLVCPTSLLWKNDRAVCERPQCLRCVARARRPPQLWRSTGRLERSLEALDALICPSRHAVEAHRSRGIRRPIVQLPYFLPDDWASSASPATAGVRPYVAAAGRLTRAKGFHELIEWMDRLPELELRIAGAGPYERHLRRLAARRENVRLLGLASSDELASLFRGARAVVVPSLAYETFGYVVLEALSAGAPVVVRRRGALAELVAQCGGGLSFETTDEAVAAIRAVASDEDLRRGLVAAGQSTLRTTWSEETQVRAYVSLVESLRAARVSGERRRAAAAASGSA